jgi:saccharopine dehydrogenase (NAD+, L-lysine-forming)
VKVLLLGVGAIGSVIARHLAAHSKVTSLTLCDQDVRRAEALLPELPPGRSSVAPLDASDATALRRAFAGQGLIVNAVVPRFNETIMDAALEAGCHYLDLAAGEEDQFARHAAWRAAGKVALHGMGEDPGISNVMARLGADKLDTVDAIRVRDGEFSESDDLPLACLFSTETFIEEVVSPARLYADGVWTNVPPWSGREVYPFPAPVGPQVIYSMSHEEVDTLPRFIGKGLRRVDFKLAVPDAMREQLTFLDRIGMTRRDMVRVGGSAVRPLAVLAAVLPQPADLGGRVRGAAIVLVEVEGTSHGNKVRHVLHAAMTHEEAFRRQRTTATACLTGTGGAAGALAIVTGRVTSPGVLAPEQLDPALMVALLKELGIHIEESTGVVTG